MLLKEVTEGATRLLTPDLSKYKRIYDAPVFYNPEMAEDRSLSVALASAYFHGREGVEAADAMCGLGARALRYSKECGFKVIANDVQPSAIEIAKKNAALNGVDVATENKEANVFLCGHKHWFHLVDVDPFGSPAPFVSSAVVSLKAVGSLLCITATDTGALSGAYPRACYRKYGIIAQKTSFAAELGVRNLVAFAFREASAHDISLRPLFGYARLHYFRVFLELMGGKKAGNRASVENVGFIGYCPKCDDRKVMAVLGGVDLNCTCGSKMMLLGPTWTGKLGDGKFLEGVAHPIAAKASGEVDIPGISIDLHVLAKKKHGLCPKRDTLIEKLQEDGYRAVPSMFVSSGIRTNAPFETVAKLFK